MASKQQDSEDTAMLSTVNEFSSFMETVAEASGLGGEFTSINNIEGFNAVVRSYIDKMNRAIDSDEIPEGLSRSKIQKFLTKKALNTDNGNGVNMLGGIMMANICKRKLEEMSNLQEVGGEVQSLISTRMRQIFTKDFVIKFSEAIPFRGGYDIGTGPVRRKNQDSAGVSTGAEDDGSYTSFFNELFKLTSGRFQWRANILAPVSNDSQCLKAMGDERGAASTVPILHDSGEISCYICGCKIKSLGGSRGQWKMQCEHILPIITALAHWWLVKPSGTLPRSITDIPGVTPEIADLLKEEYAWSHACCNLIKNNFEIVDIDASGCRPYTRGISILLQAIYEGSQPDAVFDCAEVDKTTSKCLTKLSTTKWPANFKASKYCNDQKKAIIKRLKVLCAIISNNIDRSTNFQVYTLLTKFKVMSAISDEQFLQVLLNKTEGVDAATALADQANSSLQEAKASVTHCMEECNENTKEAGSIGGDIEIIEKEQDKLNKLIKKQNEVVTNALNAFNRRGQVVQQRLLDAQTELGRLQNLLSVTNNGDYERLKSSLIQKQQLGPAFEVAMLKALLSYYYEDYNAETNEGETLRQNANEYPAELSNRLWIWSGSRNVFFTSDEEKINYIESVKGSIVAMTNPNRGVEEEEGEEGEEGEGEGADAAAQEEEGGGEEEAVMDNLAQSGLNPDVLGLRRSTRKSRYQGKYGRGGRKMPIRNNNLDTIDPNVIIPNPDIIKPDPNVIVPNPDIVKPVPSVVEPSPDMIKPDPSVVEPIPDMEPQIDEEVSSSDASGSELIKPIVKSYTQEQINEGNEIFIKQLMAKLYVNIFITELEKVDGPSFETISNELFSLFAPENIEERNKVLQSKVQTPIDLEFVNDEDEDEDEKTKTGGKTRKRKRKNKKKTKKRTNKRRRKKGRKNKKRNTRRRKNKSTKKRRKH